MRVKIGGYLYRFFWYSFCEVVYRTDFTGWFQKNFLRGESMDAMMEEVKNRRKHERLSLRLEAYCQKAGHVGGYLLQGSTLNVSTGGVLLRCADKVKAKCGDLFSLEIGVPPKDSSLEFGGRFSGYAKVVRVIESGSEADCVAFEFCGRPRLNL